MLVEEIVALEKELGRLKELKAFNREYRKIAGFPSLTLFFAPAKGIWNWTEPKNNSWGVVKAVSVLQKMGAEIPYVCPYTLS